MSVAGILSSNISAYNPQGMQGRTRQFQQEFQQLGQDLQTGNLSAAQADFATLPQSGAQANSTSSAQNTRTIAQLFNQLSADLQSGSLTGAQQDYAALKQDFQNLATQSQAGHLHHHHHHHGGSEDSAINQMFQQLGQDLQSGQLAAAQQAYGSLLGELQQVPGADGLAVTQSSSSTSAVSVTA